MNLSNVSGAWRVFKAGEVVANPAAWKQGQVTANAVTVLLAAVVASLKGFGYDLHVDDSTLAAVGTGAFALVNWLLTVVTTDKVGLLGQRSVAIAAVAGPAGDAVAGGDAHAAAQVGGQPAVARQPDPLRKDAFDQPNAGG